MSKIILCSDGTGNKGGYGADSNVFRLYNAIDLRGPGDSQITFYDNGVGTQSNKIIRVLSGAFGFGFRSNVRDLYEFLARNYAPDDEIFLFGFSRGAATVRAFAGMVQECGLLYVNPDRRRAFDEDEFEQLIDEAMEGYEKHWAGLFEKNHFPEAVEPFQRRVEASTDFELKKNTPITMIGVWDTVSALGFPQDWSWLWEKVFASVEVVSDWFFPHQFYNYQLNENVANAYHAIAIDDERTTFHPKIWREFADEKRDKKRDFERPVNIEQVWFPGVHSNVGGGYPRAGMSYFTLDWMMERAERHGLRFHEEARGDVRDAANAHGKLYDSRDGVAVYYRYAPRFIDEICEEYIEGPIKVHRSAIDRLERFTAGYAPTGLPAEFHITQTELGIEDVPVPGLDDDEKTDWERKRKNIEGWVKARQSLYRVFVEATLAVILLSFWFSSYPPVAKVRVEGFSGFIQKHVTGPLGDVVLYLVEVFLYLSPKLFDGFVTAFFINNPWWGIGLISFFFGLFILGDGFRYGQARANQAARTFLLSRLSSSEREPETGSTLTQGESVRFASFWRWWTQSSSYGVLKNTGGLISLVSILTVILAYTFICRKKILRIFQNMTRFGDSAAMVADACGPPRCGLLTLGKATISRSMPATPGT